MYFNTKIECIQTLSYHRLKYQIHLGKYTYIQKSLHDPNKIIDSKEYRSFEVPLRTHNFTPVVLHNIEINDIYLRDVTYLTLSKKNTSFIK